jgi:hypothetical protein
MEWDIDFGSCGQGYGWYGMATHSDSLKKWKDEDLAWGMRKLIELHEFFGVSELHKAKGAYVRVARKSWGATIECLSRLDCDGGAVFTMRRDDASE